MCYYAGCRAYFSVAVGCLGVHLPVMMLMSVQLLPLEFVAQLHHIYSANTHVGHWHRMGCLTHLLVLHQGWTAPAKPMGLTPWSRHGQRVRLGSPGNSILELVLFTSLCQGVGLGN